VTPSGAPSGCPSSEGNSRAYTDPTLGSCVAYVRLLKHLLARNMIDFATIVKEIVGIFAVRKKKDSQRFIIDARRANRWFTPPDEVSLATGEALSELHVGRDQTLWTGQLDIANAFYMFALPERLREFFCLRPVTAGEMGICTLRGALLTATGSSTRAFLLCLWAGPTPSACARACMSILSLSLA